MKETNQQVFRDGHEQKWIRDLQEASRRHSKKTIAICLKSGITVKQLECDHVWVEKQEEIPEDLPFPYNACKHCGLKERMMDELNPLSLRLQVVRYILLLLLLAGFAAYLWYQSR
jgi:hypothetical protein